MKLPFASTQKDDMNNWYLTFLKNKEVELISEFGFKRVKTQKKIFYCEQGKFNYSFVYVKDDNNKMFSPLRQYLGIGKHQNMNPDFKNKLLMKASRTTYQKAVEDIKDSFTFNLSKKTLNRYVIKDSVFDITQKPEEGQEILLADSTKVRNGKKGHHEVMGVMSLNYETNKSNLIAFEINVSPVKIANKLDLNRYKAFVGDADLGLRNFFQNYMAFQLCHPHAIRDVSFFLWRDGMKKKEREPYMLKFVSILYTLQNSTKKYWEDKKSGKLVNRIIRTKKNLRVLAAEFSTIEKHEAARFIMDHIEHLITAANLALTGIKVPWTTNHAERLMQEIGIRTKKKGMNWTEKGLKAVLNMVLARYFLPSDQRTYKQVFKTKKQVVET